MRNAQALYYNTKEHKRFEQLETQALSAACQAPLSMGFPRQEYWSGLPFPSPGSFPTQGLTAGLLHWQVDSTTEPPGKPIHEHEDSTTERESIIKALLIKIPMGSSLEIYKLILKFI